MPLALPGVIAGSIFTFSLTLGDYITPTLIGGASSDFIGNVVYDSVGVSNNVPFAAAFAVVPLVVMGIYLALAKRSGAFEACNGDADGDPSTGALVCGRRSCCSSCGSRS